MVRHIQLKASHRLAKTSRQAFLAEPGDKAVGLHHLDPVRSGDLGAWSIPLVWRRTRQRMPSLGENIPRKARANSRGQKELWLTHRVVKKRDFETLATIGEVAERLFG